ncbi:MAG TPA: hypothetical protein VG318_10330 [Actinomycetota bacterium]|nr:hypothetical protein [Actinomycetota bacterium]
MKKALTRSIVSLALTAGALLPAAPAHATTCSAADPNVEVVVCTAYGAASQLSCRYLYKQGLCLR